MEELKPCPFCGGEATYYYQPDLERPELKHCHNVCCDRCAATTGLCTSKEKAIAAWNNRTDNWISVEDRLPTVDPRYGEIEVLVHMDDGFIATTTYASAGFELWAESGEVTHWRPLPEPPKGIEQ